MEMGRKKSAKDLAFEKERAKYRQQINELTREIQKKEKTIYNLIQKNAELEECIRQKEEWIERLLSYTELSKEEMQKLVNKEQMAAEVMNQMKMLSDLFRI